MDKDTLKKIIDDLRRLPNETEWVEFKVNNYAPQEIGENISALSNSACLHNKVKAYIVFGIDDKSHNVIGTSFKPKNTKRGNEEIENWIATHLRPRIDFIIHEYNYDGKDVVIFEIDATTNTPVEFNGMAYIRVGTYTKKLADFSEKARKIWGKSQQQPFEKGLALKNVDEETVLALLDSTSYFKLMNLNEPENKATIIAKFIEEN